MSQENYYQLQYWKELVQTKAHINYLGEYLSATERKNRYINMFLAIASSSSIAVWAVWKEYPFIWAGIIAISQVINAIKGYLPYRKRLKAIPVVLYKFEEIFLIAEKEWFDISEGMLTKKEIHERYLELKQRKSKITKKGFGENILPEKQSYIDKAKKQSEVYFINFYSPGV